MRGKLAVILLAGISAAPIPAARASEAHLLYDVRWSGFSIGEAAIVLRIDGDGREVTIKSRTTGALDWFFTYRSTVASRGEGGAEAATSFTAESVFDEKPQAWSFVYAADGTLLEADIPAEITEERDPVPPELQRGPDPLALLLDALSTVKPGSDVRGATFDGKRALRLEARCAAELDAKSPLPGLPAEPVLACTVGGELLAGRHRDYGDRSSDENEDRELEVWLDSRRLEGMALPVLVHASTGFGTVVVRLVAFQGDATAGAARP
ncbi:MAG: DUF3108 domain-containing protein [Geminicoccaceae bacterium]|nr:DUF3108 domain-containing protein [Geminicoccaceae bacterium]